MLFSLDKIYKLSQHVDTLKTSHKITTLFDYDLLYLPFLDELEGYKKEAQAIQETNQSLRFVVKTLANMGRFAVYAQGSGVYRYHISNDDFFIKLGRVAFGADRPQLLVEYRQSFLLQNGHEGAFNLVCEFLEKIMGSFSSDVSEIHLATDVWGLRYDGFDSFRFQTNFKVKEYSSTSPLMMMASSRKGLETLSFGKGDFMLRIYNKTQEFRSSPEKQALLVPIWIVNGYQPDLKLPVWRHEIQLRGAHLKQFIDRRSADRVSNAFGRLSDMWAYAMDKVTYVPLTDDEIVRIQYSTSVNSIKSIFYRAKEDENRVNHWDSLKGWHGSTLVDRTFFKEYKAACMQKAVKYVKMAVSSVYKNVGVDFRNVERVLDEADLSLQAYHGLSLHDYACQRVLDSFTVNKKAIELYNAVPPSTYYEDEQRAQKAFEQLKENSFNREFSKYGRILVAI